MELCVEFGYRWNDIPCDVQRLPLCEINLWDIYDESHVNDHSKNVQEHFPVTCHAYVIVVSQCELFCPIMLLRLKTLLLFP
jgi:hypothetical protein